MPPAAERCNQLYNDPQAIRPQFGREQLPGSKDAAQYPSRQEHRYYPGSAPGEFDEFHLGESLKPSTRQPCSRDWQVGQHASLFEGECRFDQTSGALSLQGRNFADSANATFENEPPIQAQDFQDRSKSQPSEQNFRSSYAQKYQQEQPNIQYGGRERASHHPPPLDSVKSHQQSNFTLGGGPDATGENSIESSNHLSFQDRNLGKNTAYMRRPDLEWRGQNGNRPPTSNFQVQQLVEQLPRHHPSYIQQLQGAKSSWYLDQPGRADEIFDGQIRRGPADQVNSVGQGLMQNPNDSVFGLSRACFDKEIPSQIHMLAPLLNQSQTLSPKGSSFRPIIDQLSSCNNPQTLLHSRLPSNDPSYQQFINKTSKIPKYSGIEPWKENFTQKNLLIREQFVNSNTLNQQIRSNLTQEAERSRSAHSRADMLPSRGPTAVQMTTTCKVNEELPHRQQTSPLQGLELKSSFGRRQVQLSPITMQPFEVLKFDSANLGQESDNFYQGPSEGDQKAAKGPCSINNPPYERPHNMSYNVYHMEEVESQNPEAQMRKRQLEVMTANQGLGRIEKNNQLQKRSKSSDERKFKRLRKNLDGQAHVKAQQVAQLAIKGLNNTLTRNKRIESTQIGDLCGARDYIMNGETQKQISHHLVQLPVQYQKTQQLNDARSGHTIHLDREQYVKTTDYRDVLAHQDEREATQSRTTINHSQTQSQLSKGLSKSSKTSLLQEQQIHQLNQIQFKSQNEIVCQTSKDSKSKISSQEVKEKKKTQSKQTGKPAAQKNEAASGPQSQVDLKKLMDLQVQQATMLMDLQQQYMESQESVESENPAISLQFPSQTWSIHREEDIAPINKQVPDSGKSVKSAVTPSQKQTIELIQLIYHQMEKINHQLSRKEKIEQERFGELERKMKRMQKKYQKIKDMNKKDHQSQSNERNSKNAKNESQAMTSISPSGLSQSSIEVHQPSLNLPSPFLNSKKSPQIQDKVQGLQWTANKQASPIAQPQNLLRAIDPYSQYPLSTHPDFTAFNGGSRNCVQPNGEDAIDFNQQFPSIYPSQQVSERFAPEDEARSRSGYCDSNQYVAQNEHANSTCQLHKGAENFCLSTNNKERLIPQQKMQDDKLLAAASKQEQPKTNKTSDAATSVSQIKLDRYQNAKTFPEQQKIARRVQNEHQTIQTSTTQYDLLPKLQFTQSQEIPPPQNLTGLDIQKAYQELGTNEVTSNIPSSSDKWALEQQFLLMNSCVAQLRQEHQMQIEKMQQFYLEQISRLKEENSKNNSFNGTNALLSTATKNIENSKHQQELFSDKSAVNLLQKLMDQGQFQETLEKLNEAVAQKDLLEQKLFRIKDKLSAAKNIKNSKIDQIDCQNKVLLLSLSREEFKNQQMTKNAPPNISNINMNYLQINKNVQDVSLNTTCIQIPTDQMPSSASVSATPNQVETNRQFKEDISPVINQNAYYNSNNNKNALHENNELSQRQNYQSHFTMQNKSLEKSPVQQSSTTISQQAPYKIIEPSNVNLNDQKSNQNLSIYTLLTKQNQNLQLKINKLDSNEEFIQNLNFSYVGKDLKKQVDSKIQLQQNQQQIYKQLNISSNNFLQLNQGNYSSSADSKFIQVYKPNSMSQQQNFLKYNETISEINNEKPIDNIYLKDTTQSLQLYDMNTESRQNIMLDEKRGINQKIVDLQNLQSMKGGKSYYSNNLINESSARPISAYGQETYPDKNSEARNSAISEKKDTTLQVHVKNQQKQIVESCKDRSPQRQHRLLQNNSALLVNPLLDFQLNESRNQRFQSSSFTNSSNQEISKINQQQANNNLITDQSINLINGKISESFWRNNTDRMAENAINVTGYTQMRKINNIGDQCLDQSVTTNGFSKNDCNSNLNNMDIPIQLQQVQLSSKFMNAYNQNKNQYMILSNQNLTTQEDTSQLFSYDNREVRKY